MASLKIIRGGQPGEIFRLISQRTLMGRDPNRCEVVLQGSAVSRQHALITENNGRYFIEDLKSRNATFLNNEKVVGRVELIDGDRISICKEVFEFMDSAQKPMGRSDMSTTGSIPVFDIDPGEGFQAELLSAAEDNSSIIGTLDASAISQWRLGVKPEAKLRAVLEISSLLGEVLKLDDVLQKVLDGLFKIFPQADEGFVLLNDLEREKLSLEASKLRRSDDRDDVKISSTIVHQAMETRSAMLSADAPEDPRFKAADSLVDMQIRSVMCVPLCGKGSQPLGVIQIATRDASQQFSEDDLDVLVSVASQATLAVENARLHSDLLKQRDMERELEFAHQVQLGFLPDKCPELPGFEFHHCYNSALSVGGDYFDYLTLPDGRVVVCLGDVAGKGIPAALLMARLSSATRYHLLSRESPAEALAGLNREMSDSMLNHRFVTFIISVFDQNEGTVTTVNAGHLPLLIRKADGSIRTVDRLLSGKPLGVLPDESFSEVVLDFQPGDACVMYTDGVTDTWNRDRTGLYGINRLSDLFAQMKFQSAEDIIDKIVSDVRIYGQNQPQPDDICMVAVHRQPVG